MHEPAAHQRSAEPRGRSRRGGHVVERGPSRGASVEDRLAYYKAKYGEDFVPVASEGAKSNVPARDGKVAEKKRRPGVIQRLFGRGK